MCTDKKVHLTTIPGLYAFCKLFVARLLLTGFVISLMRYYFQGGIPLQLIPFAINVVVDNAASEPTARTPTTAITNQIKKASLIRNTLKFIDKRTQGVVNFTSFKYFFASSTFLGNRVLSFSFEATKDKSPFSGTFTNFPDFISLAFIT